MARVDLHLHTEYSPDSLSRLEEVAQQAERVGLTHLAVTDHNTIQGALRMKEVTKLPVIVGEEIMTAQGEIIGLFLRELVPPRMSAQETAEAIHSQGGLVYVPHPMDPFRSGIGDEGLAELGSRIDIIEVFNARCVLPASNDRALKAAGRLTIAQAAASDAHSLQEIGRCYVDGSEFSDAAGLLAMLRAGHMTQRRSSRSIHLLSRFATMRHRLGRRSPE